MSIRYGKALKLPRKIVKYVLAGLYPLVIIIFPLPKVKSVDETLDKILKDNCSISRFGDGEFLYIIDKLNLPFQKYEPLLAEKMKKILISNDEKVLVGLPIGYHSLNNLKTVNKITWRSQISWIFPRLRKYLDLKKIYYNASMTRFYIDFKNKANSTIYFKKIMQIWENKTVLLIEGEKSRLGVGNNLFEKTKKLERIIAPMHHSFTKYDALFKAALKYDKSTLILVALGPTATALSFDLAQEGYQAIDIGNIDIEYEWFLRGANSKVKIEGKYTSEAVGGRIVEDVNNKLYDSQIVSRFL